MLSGGDGIAERRVHDDDAARGRRRDIDVIDANACAANNFEIFGPFKNLGGHFSGGADSKPIVGADNGGELFLVLAERRLKINLDAAILEDLHGGWRKRV